MNKDLTVTIDAAYAVTEKVRAGIPCIIISSDDKYDWMGTYSNVCITHFADTEEKTHPYAISGNDVRDIDAFLAQNSGNELLVACDAGFSRSPAVAAAILSVYGREDDWIWKSSKYRPNVLVYKTILEYYVPAIPAERLAAANSRTPDGYRYYRKHGKDSVLPDYDNIIERKTSGGTIQYGFAYGNGKSAVMFIKTGGGGNIYGADNRYLKAAAFYREKYDMTVVVSSNPYDGSDALIDAEEVLREHFAENGIREKDTEVLYFGYSDGARLAADYGSGHTLFTSYLLYNLPIEQDETYDLVDKLQEIDSRQTLILAFGEEDESYKIAGYELKNGFSEMEMHILKGAEHSLTTAQAMVLPELFFDRNALRKNGVAER